MVQSPKFSYSSDNAYDSRTFTVAEDLKRDPDIDSSFADPTTCHFYDYSSTVPVSLQLKTLQTLPGWGGMLSTCSHSPRLASWTMFWAVESFRHMYCQDGGRSGNSLIRYTHRHECFLMMSYRIYLRPPPAPTCCRHRQHIQHRPSLCFQPRRSSPINSLPPLSTPSFKRGPSYDSKIPTALTTYHPWTQEIRLI